MPSSSATLLANARALRASGTDAERLLWSHLRRGQMRGLKFRRQQPFGPYVVDFYCHAARLAVELDGSQHIEAERARKDRVRDLYMLRRGVLVLRFFNDQVLTSLRRVLEEIDRNLPSR
jgi:very-short-patch-repair endonuclease